MKYLISLVSWCALFVSQSSLAVSDPLLKKDSSKSLTNNAINNVNTPKLNKRSAAKHVKLKHPGKVLNVKDQQHFYRVRMLQAQGKVVDYRIHKSSGVINKDKKKNAHSNNRR